MLTEANAESQSEAWQANESSEMYTKVLKRTKFNGDFNAFKKNSIYLPDAIMEAYKN